jgi:hypothetical protein
VFSALTKVSKVVKGAQIAEGLAVWDSPTPNANDPFEDALKTESLVAGIMLHGLDGIRIKSFSDALDLRQHPAICEFRGELNSILQMIRTGNIDGDGIRGRITKANKALALSKLADKAGVVLTLIGLPAIAWNPASVCKHFRWALLSNT